MQRTREFRRFQKEKKTKRAYNILKNEWGDLHETDDATKVRAKKMADNMKVNQCECCCNPRHSILYSGDEKLTMQERKAPDLDDELDED